MTDKTELPRCGVPEDTVGEGEQYQDLIVEEAKGSVEDGGWTISTTTSTGFGMPAAEGIDPPVKDDRVRLWTYNGSYILGMALRGTVVFYRTREEHRAKLDKQTEERRAEEKAVYEEEGKEKLEARIAALPIDFQRRIEKYLMVNPDWGWEHGSYEVFCCEQAALLGERAKAVVAEGDTEDAEEYWADKVKEGKEMPPTPELRWLTWWSALASAEFDYDDALLARRKTLMPGFSDEHSGNTYDFAYKLALIWLRSEPEGESGAEGVFRLAGALSPLVGSDSYGDPKDDEELAARWARAQEAVR